MINLPQIIESYLYIELLFLFHVFGRIQHSLCAVVYLQDHSV
jgi:hypothetical protein